METRYDGYYEREIPYKMTLEEFHERSEKNGWMKEEDFLAYLRYRNGKVLFLAPTEMPEDIMLVPLLGVFSSGRSGKALCRLMLPEDGKKYKDNMYCPIVDDDEDFHDQHWYGAYKLSITPVEFKGCIDEWYVSDFFGYVQKGTIEIWEVDEAFTGDFEKVTQIGKYVY